MNVTTTSREVAQLTAITRGDSLILPFTEKYQHPKYMFFALKDLKGQARKYTYYDADIFRREGDVKDECPDGVYMLDEAYWRRDPCWADPFREKIVREAGPVDWDEHWWNPGVTVIPDSFLDFLEMPPWDVQDKLWVTPSSKGKGIVKNMPWLNWLIAKNNIPVRPLHPVWNCLSPLTSKWGRDAKNWHLTQNEYFSAEQKVNLLSRCLQRFGPTPPLKVALVTVVIGQKFEELFTITGKRMAEKAKEWGMDLIVRRSKGRWPSPAWAKLDYPEGYDAMFFVDCDALLARNCPNPIDCVPRGYFAAFDSRSLPYPVGEERVRNWLTRIGSTRTRLPRNINSGVFVCWKEQRHLLDCPPVEIDSYYEQHALNYNLRDYSKFFPLDQLWNYGHLHKKSRDPAGAYIAHLNGIPPYRRLEVLRKLEAQL